METKESLKLRALEIARTVEPLGLRRRMSGGPGCLLEQLFPDLPEDAGDPEAPNIYSQFESLIGKDAAVAYRPADSFRRRSISREDLIAAIEAW